MLTLHFVLPLKTPVKAKTLSLEVFDPSYFVDFALAEKDAGDAWRRRRRGCQSVVAKPQEMTQGDGAEAGGDSAGRQNSGQQLRGGVLQQDIGEMSLTRVAGGRTAIALMLVRGRGGVLLAAGALDVAFAQGAPFGAPRGAPRAARRRHHRLDVRQAGRVLPELFAHHPRRQDRRQRGVDACSACPFSTASSTPPGRATARR